MAVPVGGTPVRASQGEAASPRALENTKRLGEGVRPAQLIPRTQAIQVPTLSISFTVANFHKSSNDISVGGLFTPMK